ncbi:hypothetical protein E8E13_000545 [Curvularia kusanoi]|uniref:Uncharacterized protein n=1 Tax=Curvularia kusanoi TaxID=90978 RepID=A0A9P4W702_CURKU|nr:hypothetical protein E8E13_000545 [Curvularia kusanoi]
MLKIHDEAGHKQGDEGAAWATLQGGLDVLYCYGSGERLYPAQSIPEQPWKFEADNSRSYINLLAMIEPALFKGSRRTRNQEAAAVFDAAIKTLLLSLGLVDTVTGDSDGMFVRRVGFLSSLLIAHIAAPGGRPALSHSNEQTEDEGSDGKLVPVLCDSENLVPIKYENEEDWTF